MRLREFDLAKGIGIILVVLGHFFPEGAPHWYAVIRQVIYSFHMPLFLFVSGFVYMHTRRDISYGAFLKKKVHRIVIPYFLVSFLFIAIKLVPQALSIYVKNPVTLSSFLKVFYYPEAAVSFWYLWALWWFFMIVPLLRSKGSRLMMLSASVIVAWIPLGLPDVFALPKVHEMFRYFMLGVVAYDYRNYLQWARKVPSALVYILFATLASLKFAAGVQLGLLLAVSGIWAVLRLSAGLVPAVENGRMNWLSSVASSSYTIYLFHPVFIAASLALLKAFSIPLNNGVVFAVAAACVTIVSVIGPMVIRMISEKVFSKEREDSVGAE